MTRPSSLRVQLAAGAAVLTLVVVALAGAAIAFGIDHRDRAELDAQLAERLTRVQSDLPKMLGEDPGQTQHDAGTEADDAYGGLLAGSDTAVRLIRGGAVAVSRGADINAPAPLDDGYSQITIDGTPWRSYVVDAGDGTRLQSLQSLAPLRARLIANAVLVAIVTVVSACLAGFGGWLLARRILRPLEQLRAGAVRLRAEPESDTRLPRPMAPREVTDLAGAFDELIARLHSSVRSARRFAADAGHELRTPAFSVGAYLELLARDDIEAERRAELARAAQREHARLVALLDGLQALARGDAGALTAGEEVSLADVADEAVLVVRHAHPEIEIEFDGTRGEDTTVRGWSDGIRRALDNLLENAITHGRPAGRIRVSVRRDGADVLLLVDDDGPGIRPEERGRVVERFARGSVTQAPGSGLGLAIVDQQARLHHGDLSLGDSPLGGLRAELRLPLARMNAAEGDRIARE